MKTCVPVIFYLILNLLISNTYIGRQLNNKFVSDYFESEMYIIIADL